MLVLLGPEFDGSNDSYARLAKATALVPYDLKSRLKPGSWGVVKAFADEQAARELADRIAQAGFSPVLIERSVAQDAERRIVIVAAIDFEEGQMLLRIGERTMPVPYGALCCVVEGEVQIGRTQQSFTPTPSSTSFRAPTAAEISAFRDAHAQVPTEAFLAADLHFATVLWIARIDSRHFDFGGARTGNAAHDLQILLERLAERAPGMRIDRSVKTSSVVSFALQKSGGPPASSMAPQSVRTREDQRFDPYSRIIGEAERRLRLSAPAA